MKKNYKAILEQLLHMEFEVRVELMTRNLSKEEEKRLKEILKNIQKAKDSLATPPKDNKELMKKVGEAFSWLYKIVRMFEFLS